MTRARVAEAGHGTLTEEDAGGHEVRPYAGLIVFDGENNLSDRF